MPQSGRLAGCWAKLERAKHHLDDLYVEILEWGVGDATDVPPPVGKRYDANEGCFIYFNTEVTDTPTSWSLIAGDAINNLRGALDHLAWVLSDFGAHTNNKDHVSFPICWEPNRADADIGRRIPGIDTTHKAIIKRYQPCTRTGPLRKAHPFGILQTLSNDDKHRKLLILPGRNYQCFVKLPSEYPDFNVTHTAVRSPTGQPPSGGKIEGADFTPGAELLKICGEPIPGRDPDVKVEWTCRGTVVFAETDRGVDTTLNEIAALATQLLNEFDTLV